jgi:hypothetical protein
MQNMHVAAIRFDVPAVQHCQLALAANVWLGCI